MSARTYECTFYPHGGPDMPSTFTRLLSDTELQQKLLHPHDTTLSTEVFSGIQVTLIPAKDKSCIIVLHRAESAEDVADPAGRFFHLSCRNASTGKEVYSACNSGAVPGSRLPYQACERSDQDFIAGIRFVVVFSDNPDHRLIRCPNKELWREPGKIAVRVGKTSSIRIPSDVEARSSNDAVFVFPDDHGPTRYIWANSHILASRVEYFADLFAFNGKEKRRADSESQQEGTSSLPDNKIYYSDEAMLADHLIVITAHNFLTYRALIQHLLTGTPIFYAYMESSRWTRDSVLETERPCPKAVYRLAHELTLIDLQGHALRAILDQLTVENVEEELFSELCVQFPDVRQAVWADWCWSREDGKPLRQAIKEAKTDVAVAQEKSA